MKIFISCAKEDVRAAKQIYRDLRNAGFDPWQEEDILAGQNKEFEIRNAIEKGSSHFLALLSSNSVSKRSTVLKHLKWALETLDEFPQNEIFIIPARLDDCEICDPKLQQLQYVDLFSSYEDGLGRILKSLCQSKQQENINPDKEKTEIPLIQTSNPRPGPVSKMCDRNKQAEDFMDYFQENCKNYPRRPQMYLIHGDTEERHDSFIERIRYKELRQLWEDNYIYHSDEKIPVWPDSVDSGRRRQRLIRNLTGEYSDKVKADISATDFSRLPCFGKKTLVIIRHNIDAFRWDKRHDTDLIDWYRDYWSTLDCNEKTPLFLIFLNIGYRKESKVSFKEKMCFWNYCSPKTVESKLTEIADIKNKNCPCSLISKLEPVNEFYVREWLKIHARRFESEWEKIISEIFSGKNSKVSMNVIETVLLKLLKDQDKNVWE